MHRNSLVLMGVLLLAGCGADEAEEGVAPDAATSVALEVVAPPDQAAPAPAATAARDAASPPARASAPVQVVPGAGAATPMLAYAYGYRIEAPVRQVIPLARRHEQACVAAGAMVCQVVSAQSEATGRDEVTAELAFRATPAYVDRFRNGLGREIDAAAGEIRDSRVTTEDLTRSFVDTEAGVRARRLLQGRLEQLIASRPGNLQQLLELERELARVQGEIDTMQSNLEVMRARVRMSNVTLNYASRGAAITDRSLNPLVRAARDFVGNLALSLSVIVDLLSMLLPWLVLVALGAWGVLVWRRRRPRRTPVRPAAAAFADAPSA